MAKQYVLHRLDGFATGIVEARREPRISSKAATRLVLIGIIVILLIAAGYFDFILKGVLGWLGLRI